MLAIVMATSFFPEHFNLLFVCGVDLFLLSSSLFVVRESLDRGDGETVLRGDPDDLVLIVVNKRRNKTITRAVLQDKQ